MHDKFVSIPQGRIHYLHGGSGEPLVLLHSNGGSAYDFEAVFERLGRHFEIFALDLPGQGDSDPIPRHWTVADYADAVIAFMDAAGLDKASVLGVSIGGAVCVALGAHHSARLRNLYIVESPYRSAAEWQGQWARIEANFALPVQTLAAVAPRLKHVDDAFLLRWNIDRSKAGAKVMMSVMWALREYDATLDLPKVPPGAMVIYGDKGPTISGKASFIGLLREPRVEIMEGCGHFPMFDAPDEFCALVEQHANIKS